MKLSKLLFVLVLLLGLVSGRAQTTWELAQPGWEYVFPRDHGIHPGFKTEWWYFTGNVATTEGRRFGYQLTFFRQGIRPPAERAGTTSRFIVDDLKFGHFALSDLSAGRFYKFQRESRGAFGEAGFADGSRLAWLENWTFKTQSDGSWHIEATETDARISFAVRAVKPWAIHGERGISEKADGEGHASHYYSGTRLATEGSISVAGRTYAVSGTSWFDHEWASNQLTPEQLGWNWFSLHFDDGSELMLYQMRRRDGGIDPNSSGTFIAADGSTQHLRRDDYQLTPLAWWQSTDTGGRYPVSWRIEIPSLQFRAELTTPFEKQEMVLTPVTYWEGTVDVRGERRGRKIKGEGYLEMTGYAGALVGLSQPPP